MKKVGDLLYFKRSDINDSVGLKTGIYLVVSIVQDIIKLDRPYYRGSFTGTVFDRFVVDSTFDKEFAILEEIL